MPCLTNSPTRVGSPLVKWSLPTVALQEPTQTIATTQGIEYLSPKLWVTGTRDDDITNVASATASAVAREWHNLWVT